MVQLNSDFIALDVELDEAISLLPRAIAAEEADRIADRLQIKRSLLRQRHQVLQQEFSKEWNQ